MYACLDAARLVLSAGRFLLRVGLVCPENAATALRWSCWLNGRGMLFRQSLRLRGRC